MRQYPIHRIITNGRHKPRESPHAEVIGDRQQAERLVLAARIANEHGLAISPPALLNEATGGAPGRPMGSDELANALMLAADRCLRSHV